MPLANYSSQLINSTTYNSGFGDTAAVDYKFEFSISGNSANNILTFTSNGPGLSFDKLSVDTIAVTAVPEASTAIMAMAAISLLGGWRLRRKQCVQ